MHITILNINLLVSFFSLYICMLERVHSKYIIDATVFQEKCIKCIKNVDSMYKHLPRNKLFSKHH